MRRAPTKFGKNTQESSGMTMVEMIASLGIISIVGAIGIVNLPELTGSLDRNNLRHTLELDITRSQADASSMGSRVVFVFSNGGRTYRAGFDNLPYSDPPAIDTNIFTRTLKDSLAITPSQQIIFDSRGFLVNSLGQLTTTTVTVLRNGINTDTLTIYSTGTVE
jgi:type II secretory pathway pseudopilin PulG